MHDLIAVFDAGKSNTKLCVLDAETGQAVRTAQRANRSVREFAMNQLDVAGMEDWLLATLRAVPEKARITALVPVAHGAACVLVDATGNVLAAPDYEDGGFAETAAAYGEARGGFAETQSPRLPAGLNLGAQLFFLETRRPEVFVRAARFLLLPQFWAWRFSGIAATEVSSLGAHTDLWRPKDGNFSALATQRRWHERFPPLRRADELLGPLAPEIVAATGLPADCVVLCGVHDSNASWLSHRFKEKSGAGLTVISSGTWTIAMKSAADLDRLREDRDMLANVDVFGSPLATARFMGGREYAAIAGTDPATPTGDDLRRVVAARAIALPAFAEAGGPFQGCAGRIERGDGLSRGERAALASLYVVLVTDVMLDLLGDSGTLVIDGPFAANALYAGLMKTLRPQATVAVSAQTSGASAGAMSLVLGEAMPPVAVPDQLAEPMSIDGLSDYRSEWRALCGSS